MKVSSAYDIALHKLKIGVVLTALIVEWHKSGQGLDHSTERGRVISCLGVTVTIFGANLCNLKNCDYFCVH